MRTGLSGARAVKNVAGVGTLQESATFKGCGGKRHSAGFLYQMCL